MPKAIDAADFLGLIGRIRSEGHVVAVAPNNHHAVAQRHSRRRLIVDDWRYDVHHLRNVCRFKGRNAIYTMGNVVKATIFAVDGHIFFVTADGRSDLLVIPSEDLAALFADFRRTERSIYIALDGSPGKVFNFWGYRNAWPKTRQYVAAE